MTTRSVDSAALRREIEAAVATLERLGEQGALVGPQVIATSQQACRDAHRRLTREALCAVVLGEPAARAAFLDSVVGHRVFGAARPGGHAGPVIFLRHAARPGYQAIYEQGPAFEFQDPAIEKIEALTAELAQAAAGLPPLADTGEEDATLQERSRGALAQAGAEVARAQSELAERDQATVALRARVPGFVGVRPPGWAVWLWLLRVLLGGFYRRRTVELADENGRLEQARARLETARASHERASLEDRRVRLFLANRSLHSRFVHDLVALRGGKDPARPVRELHIEVPARHLAPGVTPIEAPALGSVDGEARRRARQVVHEETDGVIVVQAAGQGVEAATLALLEEVRPGFPHLLVAPDGVERLARQLSRPPADLLPIVASGEALVELLRSERLATAAARLVSAAKGCARAIAAADAQLAEGARKRLAEVDALQVVGIEEFKARQLQKVRAPAEEGAAAVVEAARQTLREAVERTAESWKAELEACESRDKLKALVSELGKRPADKAMVSSALRLVEGLVAEKSAAVVERLQRVLIEELVQRRAAAQQRVGAPPSAEDDLLAARAPAAGPTGVQDAILFTDSGEAAAAAAGAVVIGVLGGLFQGLDALKQDCVEKVYNGVAELEQRLAAELASSAPTIALGIESALAARLGASIAAFERALARYRHAAERAAAAERERLASLRALGSALSGHQQRLEALINA